jgi:hypothetical protein
LLVRFVKVKCERRSSSHREASRVCIDLVPLLMNHCYIIEDSDIFQVNSQG